jgi:hypothetical protein
MTKKGKKFEKWLVIDLFLIGFIFSNTEILFNLKGQYLKSVNDVLDRTGSFSILIVYIIRMSILI